MPKEKNDGVFYVGVKDPIEIRRSILESSKEMLQYLQRAEKFKEVRKEKTEQIVKLKETMNDVHVLVRKLKAHLPKTGLRSKTPKEIKFEVHKIEAKEKAKEHKEEEKQKPKKHHHHKKKVEAEAAPKEASELEKLEAELGEIENRLTKLT